MIDGQVKVMVEDLATGSNEPERRSFRSKILCGCERFTNGDSRKIYLCRFATTHKNTTK